MTPRRSAREACRRQLGAGMGLVLVAWMALALVTPPARSQTGAGDPAAKLTFVSQTQWVPRGGTFELTVRVDPAPAASTLELVASVFPAVTTRSEFAFTLTGPPRRLPLFVSTPAVAGPAGTVTITVPVQDANAPRDPARVRLGANDGVHPVVVELRESDGGPVRDQLLTHLIHLPDVHTGPALGVALVLPVHNPPDLAPDGTRRRLPGEVISSLPQALDALNAAPVTLRLTPETIDALVADPSEPAVGALTGLRRAASTNPVLTSTYVPIDLPGLIGPGLATEATTQVARGSSTISQILKTRVDGRTWLTDQPLDQPSLEFLAGQGIDRLVIDDRALAALDGQNTTLTRPFRLRAGAVPMEALAADSGLAAHFVVGNAPSGVPTSPALQANHLLADLTVVFLDLPGERRGVVVAPPRSWFPEPDFLRTLSQGLTGNPVVAPVSLDSLFASVPAARTGSGALLVRRSLAASEAPADLGGLSTEVARLRQRLNSLGTVMGPDNALPGLLDKRLLTMESVDLAGSRSRAAYLRAVDGQIDAALAQIQVPTGRSITLTARRGVIPLTFQNRTGHPARVTVSIQSDKLGFPGGPSLPLELTRLNTTRQFPVVARTSGAFPVRILLSSPDGKLVVSRARLTVRSTAAPGLGVAVSVGAALFLALWWGRETVVANRHPSTPVDNESDPPPLQEEESCPSAS